MLWPWPRVLFCDAFLLLFPLSWKCLSIFGGCFGQHCFSSAMFGNTCLTCLFLGLSHVWHKERLDSKTFERETRSWTWQYQIITGLLHSKLTLDECSKLMPLGPKLKEIVSITMIFRFDRLFAACLPLFPFAFLLLSPAKRSKGSCARQSLRLFFLRSILWTRN